MKIPTDLACQKFLAKCLPEKLNLDHGNEVWWNENRPVLPTEWAQIALDVEGKLTPDQCDKYVEFLAPFGKSKCPLSSWSITHATYQQRAIALAKVMGKEIE